MKRNFTGFGLLTKDVNRMRTFYETVLEAESEDNDTHSVVQFNGFAFALYNPEKHANAETLFREHGGSSLWLEFEVDDVDGEYERLTDLGIQPIIGPKNTEFGRRVIYLKDPDGNRLTLYKPVSNL